MNAWIPMQLVDSSALSAVGYDVDSKTLAVRFNSSGKLWHYIGVTPNDYQALMKSDSIGRAFSKDIKGQFDSMPITEDGTDGQ